MNTGRTKSNSISSLHRAFRRNCFRFHLSLTVYKSFLLGDNKIIVFIKNGEILLRGILHISSIHFAMGKKSILVAPQRVIWCTRCLRWIRLHFTRYRETIGWFPWKKYSLSALLYCSLSNMWSNEEVAETDVHKAFGN